MKAHVCSFSALPKVTRRTKYETFKRDALEAGRYSVFEASENETTAAMFDRLCNDPEVETFDLPFPWTGVRRK